MSCAEHVEGMKKRIHNNSSESTKTLQRESTWPYATADSKKGSVVKVIHLVSGPF